ncbi:FMRFamide receptor [Amphibalanus amphitrite]|uniref:FMRFamide receptor n=1 Tax=Amphibalanus amphitrite TaxID=1232801 RepID=A0A6A4X490_AMPAM|nr:FMRFamide receptor [Amphibalanus amphitrite]
MLGIVCNTISIYILSRKQMRASINCCLIGLATFDILLLVCSIFVWGLPAISQYSGGMRSLTSRIIPHMTPWLYPLATIAHTGSTYVTVTVTVERYVAVCHSLKARYICTYGRARLYMILISIFVVVYNVPKFLETEVQPIVNIRENRTIVGYIACPTPLRNERTYIEVYIMWMYFIVMYCIPFGTLVILNSLIYRNVRIANRMRQLLSRRQQKEIGLATMLFAIVLLFMEAGMERIADFSNLLININSSSNFVIYCIFGQKFRRLFLRLFCERLLRRRCGTLGCAEDMSMAGPTADASSVPMKRMYRGSNATETENGEDHRLLVASRGSHYSPVSMTTLSVNLPTSTTSVSGV